MITTLKNDNLVVDDFYYILAKAAMDDVEITSSDMDIKKKEVTVDNPRTRIYLQKLFGFKEI